MVEFRYRAFISYSHLDEAWAKWLHRALESYRVPRKVTGRQSVSGIIPARINPVFRDRDELTAARSLSEKVLEGLRQSEALIVLCSPAAADSQWVNDEIRTFRSLGRADRVFCMVVDGDPGAGPGADTCFPPALFAGAEESDCEPLAADPRKWADGKHLAVLKLVAGLLGIGLDELRQRDLKRRRRWRVVLALGLSAALVLAVVTVMSRISEQHEREKAEQLATFIVDLGERVQSDVDLETLAIISQEAAKHLEGLDPGKLSPETSIKVGLAIRQLARVSELQGKPEEALTAYERSRELFENLNARYPENLEILFELGQAEFWKGNLHLHQGEYFEATQALQSSYRVAEALVDVDPENPAWIMELSYAHTNMAALQLDSGGDVNAKTLANLSEAIRLIEQVLALSPSDHTVVGHYATTLAWNSDAHLMACELETARFSREKTLELAASASSSDPSDNDLKRRHAFALSGLATVQTAMGDIESAERNMRQVLSMLEELLAADPSNVMYQENVSWRTFLLATLLGDTGHETEAISMMQSIAPELEKSATETNLKNPRFVVYVEFLLVYADLEYRVGNLETAAGMVKHAMSLMAAGNNAAGLDHAERHRLLLARYQWWEIHNKSAVGDFPILLEIEPESEGEYRDCRDADISARIFVLENDPEAAARQVSYLSERGYAEPSYIRFCRRHHLCSD